MAAAGIIGHRPTRSARRPNGIFAAIGSDIKEKMRQDLSLIDIVPTCLHLLGLPVPSDMDGKVAGSILETDNEVRMEKAGQYARNKQEYDSESEEVIKDRLRSLGYIE